MGNSNSSSASGKVKSLALDSYAKLNLYLEVLGRREDNYHNINTLFERISLSDKITLKPRRDNKIKIICSNPDVPEDDTNLCYRSVRLLQDSFGIERGLDIKIIKRIPVSAGLGGGSGNAAAVLVGLGILTEATKQLEPTGRVTSMQPR